MELSRTEYTDALADLNRVINDKDTRQLKSKDVKSKDVLIVQRSVATLCTTLDIVSPLQRLIHDKSGPCHMTQLEDTGEQP